MEVRAGNIASHFLSVLGVYILLLIHFGGVRKPPSMWILAQMV